MELRVNLNDRQDCIGAHALLASVLAASAVAVDPAAVFGQQSATPLPGTPAPSTAAAGLSQTALGGLPGISVEQSTALPGLPASGGLLASVGLAAAPTNPVGSVDLDADGLPWDERIHSSSKVKNGDGRWKKLKGFNDAAKLAAIQAELRASVQGQAAQSATPLPGLPAATVAPTALPGSALPSALPGIPATDPTTFEQMMTRLSPAAASGTLPPDALQRVCLALSLPNVVALQTQPQFVPQAWALIKQHFPAAVQ